MCCWMLGRHELANFFAQVEHDGSTVENLNITINECGCFAIWIDQAKLRLVLVPFARVRHDNLIRSICFFEV